MKVFNLSITTLTILTAALTGCGGGGGDDERSNNPASITGTSTGAVSATRSEASGVLTVADIDAGQATFVQPTNLSGTYGTWSVVISGAQATWRFTLNTNLTTAVGSSETLTLRSQDGTATQSITVSIAAGSALVTTVPDPVYSGAYAAEKVAVFNRLNEDRARCGFGKLAQSSKLDAAAQNHATYLALNLPRNITPNSSTSGHTETQGNPGFTGATPADRVDYVGYPFSLVSENVGYSGWWGSPESPEPSATNPLLFLYATVYHLASLMDRFTEVGLGVANILFGPTLNAKGLTVKSAIPFGNATGQPQANDAITTFPCQGSAGLLPAFGGESPDPFPAVNRDLTPYGQPIFVQSGLNTTLTLTSGTITLRDGAAVPITTLTASNDPQRLLPRNQVFLVPTTRLLNNAIYDVALSGTSSGMVTGDNPSGLWSRNFSFTTGTMTSQ